jgi:signal peptidase
VREWWSQFRLSEKALAVKVWVQNRLDPLGVRVQAVRRWWWVFIVVWIALIYVVSYFILPGAVSAAVYQYVMQPVFWLSLAFLAYMGWKYGLQQRPSFSRSLSLMAALYGAFQVAVFVIAGLLTGFGNSPHSHRLPALFGNLLYVGAALIGTEMSRAYLMAVSAHRRRLLGLTLVTLFFSLVSIPVGRYGLLNSPLNALRQGGEVFLPTISENLLASFLAFIGGPVASIAYRGILQAFEWLSPILPDLNWLVTAFLGTLVPALGLLVFREGLPGEEAGGGGGEHKDVGSGSGWILVAVVAVSLLWFNTGLLGIRPSLISGQSMEPTFGLGDIAISRDVPVESLQVGDIIRFRQQGMYVVHRIKAMHYGDSGTEFITRGDGNNVDDPPVSADKVEGKVILVIPKIGWIGIGVRQAISWVGGLLR